MRQTKSQMSSDKNAKLVGLFFVAMIVFTFPILGIFGKEKLVLGFPLVYIYIFVSWFVIIFLIRQLFKKRNQNS